MARQVVTSYGGSSLLQQRELLKISLACIRGKYSPGRRLRPMCPICGKFIDEAPDMHEALITKGQVSGHKKQDLINDRRNCVLVHHRCHMSISGIGGDDTFEKCSRQLVEWEGLEEVRTWLTEMAGVFPIVGKLALMRFNAMEWSVEHA